MLDSGDAELEVIRALPPDPVVVDGGGGTGDWTAALLAARPGARVVVFEPHPWNHRECVERFAGDPRVVVLGYALAAEHGRSRLHIDGPEVGLGHSLVKRGQHVGTILVPTINLGSWWFGRLDMVKLDIEGGEPEVLESIARSALRPALIQFEWGGTWDAAGASLDDSYALLIEAGYTLDPQPTGTWGNICARLS